MNLQNIISAGRMISIVAALLGAFHCGAAFAVGGGGTFAMEGCAGVLDLTFGAAFIVCGLALVIMIPRAAGHAGYAVASLIAGTLVALVGTAAVVLTPHDPFSWMIGTVGLAIFIDTLCLKVKLKMEN
jgi:hypothetical protein